MTKQTGTLDDILGADYLEEDGITIGQETNQAILIKVKNAGDLAKSQGALASFAQALAPATIEAKVISTIRDKLAESLHKENVDAEVTVVDPKNFVASSSNHVWTDVGYAIGGAGILAALWYLFKGKSK